MPKLLLFLLLVGIALPAFAAKPVTVTQLEQVLVAAQGQPDTKVAEQLSELELTERLSEARRLRWEAELPGPESRQALMVLADMSAFLNLPAIDIPATPTPDLAEQQKMIALSAAFAKKTISRLPNFFATRETIRFKEDRGIFRDSYSLVPQPIHMVDRSKDTVLYRNGREVVDLTATERKKYGLATPGLTTSGVFGPILGMVLMDIAHGTLAWSHWEQGRTGQLAVFRYNIPMDKSHYEVELASVFQDRPGYHGEFAVDPANGDILRLTLESDLRPSDPISRSAILVEYGPVEIGGKTYICPLKNVSIETAKTESSPGTGQYGVIFHAGGQAGPPHLRTSLNDVAFERYHIFRADARVLTGDNEEPAADGSASSPAETAYAGSAAATDEKPLDAVAAEANTPPPAAPSSLPAAPAMVSTPAPQPAAPAIAVANPTAPEPIAPASTVPQPSAGTVPTPTFRVTSRIVYVDVVVRDRHGHVVRGLTQNDFKVSEEGTAQKIDFFRAFTHDSPTATSNPSPGALSAGPVPSNTSPENAVPDTINMILFDLLDTSPANQAYARTQMLKFLGTLPPGHKIALFVLADKLRMIQNVTGSSELLADAARQLLPKVNLLFESGAAQMQHADILGTLPGFATPGGEDNSVTADLVENLSVENFQHDQVRNNMVNNAFRALAQATAAFTGRKNLFWLAESFPLGAITTLQSFQPSLGSSAFRTDPSDDRAIAGSRIAVYPISVLGMETSGVDASLNGRTTAAGPDPGGPLAQNTLNQQSDTRDVLRGQMEDIAAETGGEAFVGTNDIAGALRKSLDAGENYYSLVYTPTNENWNGKFRKIQVKATHKGYSLSYRRGYFALPEPPASSAGTQR